MVDRYTHVQWGIYTVRRIDRQTCKQIVADRDRQIDMLVDREILK